MVAPMTLLERQEMKLTKGRREAVARIILGKKSHWNTHFSREALAGWIFYPEVARAFVKADQIIDLFITFPSTQALGVGEERDISSRRFDDPPSGLAP
jgi:hypothetical protein